MSSRLQRELEEARREIAELKRLYENEKIRKEAYFAVIMGQLDRHNQGSHRNAIANFQFLPPRQRPPTRSQPQPRRQRPAQRPPAAPERRRRHGRIQSNGRLCQCGDRFGTKEGLEGHLREKLNVWIRCDAPNCNYISHTSNQIRAHRQKHHPDLPRYPCMRCGTFYWDKDEKREHQKRVCRGPKIKIITNQPFESVREPEEDCNMADFDVVSDGEFEEHN